MSHAENCYGEGGIMFLRVLLKMTAYPDVQHTARQVLDNCRMSSFCPVVDKAWPRE